MGYEDTGYEQQKLQYETGETRPVNPPSMIANPTLEISDTVTYDLFNLIKIAGYPAEEWSMWLEDEAGNIIKSILSAEVGDQSAVQFQFTYADYQAAIDDASDFTPLPNAQVIYGFMVTELDNTGEQKRVPVVITPDTDCYHSFTLTHIQVPQGETFPYTVNAEDFVSVPGNLSDFELSADDGDTWSYDYEITVAPTQDVQVPFLVRALAPCVTDGVGTYFVRLGPS